MEVKGRKKITIKEKRCKRNNEITKDTMKQIKEREEGSKEEHKGR